MADESEWLPRVEPIPGGGAAFIHPCSVCGSKLAFYGFGVDTRKGKPGIWRCHEHRVDNLQTSASTSPKPQRIASAPKPPKPEPPAPDLKKPVEVAEPKQGDLF
jgi:hypothetical protein